MILFRCLVSFEYFVVACYNFNIWLILLEGKVTSRSFLKLLVLMWASVTFEITNACKLTFRWEENLVLICHKKWNVKQMKLCYSPKQIIPFVNNRKVHIFSLPFVMINLMKNVVDIEVYLHTSPDFCFILVKWSGVIIFRILLSQYFTIRSVISLCRYGCTYWMVDDYFEAYLAVVKNLTPSILPNQTSSRS